MENERPCSCGYNHDTGYFEACCEEHEREYVDWLEQQAELKKQKDSAL